MQGEIAYLREQLEAERQAHAEARMRESLIEATGVALSLRCRLGTLGDSSATAATVRWVNCYDRRSRDRAEALISLGRSCSMHRSAWNRYSPKFG